MYRTLVCIICLLTVFTVGCKPSGRGFASQYVEGVVTLDKQPVEKGIVTFTPKDGNMEIATGSTDLTGKFTLTSSNGDVGKGALAGDYLVTISKVKVTRLDEPRPVPGTPIMTSTEVEELLPIIYQDKEDSPLSVTVKKGKNKYNFDLSSTQQ